MPVWVGALFIYWLADPSWVPVWPMWVVTGAGSPAPPSRQLRSAGARPAWYESWGQGGKFWVLRKESSLLRSIELETGASG